MGNVDAHIKIYAEDFPGYIWEEYCSICKVSSNAEEICIGFDYDNVESDEDDFEEWWDESLPEVQKIRLAFENECLYVGKINNETVLIIANTEDDAEDYGLDAYLDMEEHFDLDEDEIEMECFLATSKNDFQSYTELFVDVMFSDGDVYELRKEGVY
jgi:hypothetical protein